MVNLVRFARGAPCTKVLMGISSLCIMIAFIITTVVVTSGKTASSRNFYLVSFEYDKPANHSLTKGASDFINSVNDFLSSDKNDSTTFSSVRVGFSGVCVHISSSDDQADSWRCGSVAATNELGKKASGDPFDLIEIAAFYKDKIAFAMPLWIATGALGFGMLCIFVGSIPLIPVPPVVQRVAAGLSILGSLSLLGGLVLMHVTTNAVVTLSTRLTMGTVQAHPGTANQAFGWAAFALAVIATIAVTAVASAEYVLQRAEIRAQRAIDHVNEKVTSRIPSSSASVASSAPTGLGRSLGGFKLDNVAELARARTRGEALHAIAHTVSDRKKPGDNVV